jgi:hypothetical protein
MTYEKSELFELVLNCLPYPGQISEINFELTNAIGFKWRQSTYRISNNLMVEEAENGMLIGSDKAIIFRALLDKTALIRNISQP